MENIFCQNWSIFATKQHWTDFIITSENSKYVESDRYYFLYKDRQQYKHFKTHFSEKSSRGLKREKNQVTLLCSLTKTLNF